MIPLFFGKAGQDPVCQIPTVVCSNAFVRLLWLSRTLSIVPIGNLETAERAPTREHARVGIPNWHLEVVEPLSDEGNGKLKRRARSVAFSTTLSIVRIGCWKRGR